MLFEARVSLKEALLRQVRDRGGVTATHSHRFLPAGAARVRATVGGVRDAVSVLGVRDA